jgi:peptidoglycan L-alanyl-D-glutamate endopeptidase CwlK
MNNMFTFSRRSLAVLTEGIHPELILVFREAIKVTPIDFGIPENGGYHSTKYQKELYLAGESSCDGTHKVSKHQKGKAVHFFAVVDGEVSKDKQHSSMVAAVILSTAKRLKEEGRIKIKLMWGGEFGSRTFTGWHMPHIEITQW